MSPHLYLFPRESFHAGEENQNWMHEAGMLTYYVDWHMHKTLAPILFEDEELPQQRKRRDPIRPAEPSESAKRKKATHLTADGLPAPSFETLHPSREAL